MSFIVNTIMLSPSADFVTVRTIPWESVWQICKLLAILVTAQVMTLSRRGNWTLSKSLGFFLLCSFSSFSLLFFLFSLCHSHAHTHPVKSYPEWSPGIVPFSDFLDCYPESLSLLPESLDIGEKACQNVSFRNSYVNIAVEVAHISEAGPNPFT